MVRSYKRAGKKRSTPVQGRLKFTFENLDPQEPVMLLCGHLVLYKYVSEYGYGWCAKCGCKKPKMY